MVELIWDNKKEMLEKVNSEDFLKTDKYLPILPILTY